jgi:hypothetical protein
MELRYGDAMKDCRLSVQQAIMMAFSLCLLLSFGLYPSVDDAARTFPSQQESSAIYASGASKTALRQTTQASLSKTARQKPLFNIYDGNAALTVAEITLPLPGMVVSGFITLVPQQVSSGIRNAYAPRAPPGGSLHC